MGLGVRHEWPMESYLAAWKTFRQAANENKIIAQHLVSQPSWPRGKKLRICDIGCGDGRLLEALIFEAPDEVAEVCLIDPDYELLQEAARSISERNYISKVSTTLAKVESVFPDCASGFDVVLMIHLVYLIESESLVQLLRALPRDLIVYILFDAPTSVFTSLWAKTAPKYRDRVVRAHDIIASLTPSEFAVQRTEVEARVPNPFDLPREDLRNAILSLLCYSSDVLADSDMRAWARSTIERYVDEQGNVACRSACYEIQRV